MSNQEIPILFLVFNRPDTTLQVFNWIKTQRPKKLYIAADGYRSYITNEQIKCEKVKAIVSDIGWPCEIFTLFRNKNLGCKKAVSEAIDWFFENEEMGIILEDDCVPSNSFYKFCKILLNLYVDEERIMMISGNNFYPFQRKGDFSYYFTKYVHCWGWATWKRAWKYYDHDMMLWNSFKKGGGLKKILNDRSSVNYWYDQFDMTYQGKINSWAYVWMLSMWQNNGVSIIPESNMVRNIGMGDDATHTKQIDQFLDKIMVKHEITFPLKHPKSIVIDEHADNFVQHKVINPKITFQRIRKYLVNKLVNIINNG